MNNIDIMYYEYMIERTREDREIMELCISNEFNKKLLDESEYNEELAIYEANVITNIIDVIKKVFQKVIDFIKNLIENITGKKFFKANKKLIDKATEKAKSMDSAEKDAFHLVNIDISKTVQENLQWGMVQHGKCMSYLNLIIGETNKFLAKPYTRGEGPSQAQLNKVRINMKNLNEELDELSNKDKMRKEAKDIKFNDIRTTIDQYSKSSDEVQKLNKDFNEIIKSMKDNKRIMDAHVSVNQQSIIRKYDQAQLKDFRELITLVSNYIIKLSRFRMNMHILEYKNQEAILRRFVGGDLDTEVKERPNPNTKMIAQKS